MFKNLQFLRLRNTFLAEKLLKFVKSCVFVLGYSLIRIKKNLYQELSTSKYESISRWRAKDIPSEFSLFVLDNVIAHGCISQLQQDLAAQFFLAKSGRENGYFVEFGATNGLKLSNTYLLETAFSWNGIVAEPSKQWHEDLQSFRKCDIDYRCVWSQTGDWIEFSEVPEGEFSTISIFSAFDGNERLRKTDTKYLVETVSLDDLLKQRNAPTEIDFLSIDTEGSEYEILRVFPFSEWVINFIAVEHNYSENNALLEDLLEKNGFIRIFPIHSMWDGWYLRKDHPYTAKLMELQNESF